MSCNSTATIIFGIKLDNNELKAALEAENSKHPRNCEHVRKMGWREKREAKFCPKCGSSVIEDNEIGESELIDSLNLSYTTCTDSLDYFLTTDNKYMASTEDINAGVTWERINMPNEMELFQIKAKLKEKLEPFGLWNEKNFSAWIVGYCSY